MITPEENHVILDKKKKKMSQMNKTTTLRHISYMFRNGKMKDIKKRTLTQSIKLKTPKKGYEENIGLFWGDLL